MNKGKLYLIPVPLGTSTLDEILPLSVQERARGLRHFIAENAKTARAFLKLLGTPIPIQEIDIQELDKPDKEKPAKPPTQLLRPLLEGIDVGLVSEAGCPAVADPGSEVVALAHQAGIEVVPLVGPSSILLSLMASGLSGQNFSFHGYLPVKEALRQKKIKDLENDSRREQRTQIFIETPYRNRQMFETLLATCAPTTRICIAANLTQENAFVLTLSVRQWKERPPPELNRLPVIFLIQA